MSELMHQLPLVFSKKTYYPHTYVWNLQETKVEIKEGRGERPMRKEV